MKISFSRIAFNFSVFFALLVFIHQLNESVSAQDISAQNISAQDRVAVSDIKGGASVFVFRTSRKAPPKKVPVKTTVVTKVVKVTKTTNLVVAGIPPKTLVELKSFQSSAKNRKSLASESGSVEFENLIPGKYTVTASLEGYQPVETKVEILPQKTSGISLELKRLIYQVRVKTNVISGEVRFAPARLKGFNPNGSLQTEETGLYTIAPIREGVAIVPELKSGYYNFDVRAENNDYFPVLSVLNIPEDISENEFLKIELNKRPVTADENLKNKDVVPKINFGRYYALVIGNNDYQKDIRKLKNAVNDAKRMVSVLSEKYGFETKLLTNAKRQDILSAINYYRNTMTENDNLLIFYSGHGYFDTNVDEAYWIPVDADKDDNTNWISANDITKNIRGMKSKHVLVVSDSCYSGTIDREIGLIESEAATGRERYLQKLVASKSRTLIASGGNEPVTDGGGENSVFTKALLTGLEKMDRKAFTAAEIFRDFIQEQVAGGAKQTPEFKNLRNSGHESGDFIFVRKQ